MRILITGGCGYVGTVLTQILLNERYEIGVITENITAKTIRVIGKKWF